MTYTLYSITIFYSRQLRMNKFYPLYRSLQYLYNYKYKKQQKQIIILHLLDIINVSLATGLMKIHIQIMVRQAIRSQVSFKQQHPTYNYSYHMFTIEKANELQVIDKIPPLITHPVFTEKKILWVKESKHPIITNKDINGKRYEYVKIGKTFGFETTRYFAFTNGHLFYYDSQSDKQYKGYCCLENVYVQWLTLKTNRYLLFITNGSENCYFFFSNSTFWQENHSDIGKHAIQLDFKQQYEVIEQIGKGSFSKVFHVRHINSKKQFAAKIINKKDKHKACTKGLVMQQRKILRLINSQYVYKFEQLFEEQQFYVAIIEYLPGKDLMTLFKQKKVSQPHIVLFLLRQILEGIRDIHRANVIHRDLKPQNILINLTNLKPFIIDFGLSLYLDETVTPKSYKRCGTMGYMAPEVIENTGEHKKAYGPKCDLFSFGIIAHMLLVGYNPLKGENYDQTFQKNKACDIDLNKKLINSAYGEHCFIFLTKSLSKYPQFRYDADQALNSTFLKQKFGEKDKEQSSSTIEQKKKVLFHSIKGE